mmetsp:Transcript_128227/g.304478  ORF Transcript_128227/g.304478 Transcript_128227/m.304478 type:complete len:208 (+) Transcript_128227:1021-1644(+)
MTLAMRWKTRKACFMSFRRQTGDAVFRQERSKSKCRPVQVSSMLTSLLLHRSKVSWSFSIFWKSFAASPRRYLRKSGWAEAVTRTCTQCSLSVIFCSSSDGLPKVSRAEFIARIAKVRSITDLMWFVRNLSAASPPFSRKCFRLHSTAPRRRSADSTIPGSSICNSCWTSSSSNSSSRLCCKPPIDSWAKPPSKPSPLGVATACKSC